MKEYIRALSPRLEFAIVVIGAFGIFIAGSLFAVFGPTDRESPPITNDQLQSVIAYETVVAVLLLTFLKIRQWTLQGFGLVPSLRETFVGIGLAITAYLAYVVVFLIATGLSPSMARAAAELALVAPGLSVPLVIVASIINPTFEELFVSGYVISALREGGSFWTAVNTSIAIRLSYHLYQGPIGILNVIPVGFLFAVWYARTGRLWPLIAAHAILDAVGLLASG